MKLQSEDSISSKRLLWLYYRFPLSLRGVEDLLAERGINVSFQTVSEWAAKFGLKFAHQLRRRSRGHFADKWQFDEMVVTIRGRKYWLWRAVDANGYVPTPFCMSFGPLIAGVSQAFFVRAGVMVLFEVMAS